MQERGWSGTSTLGFEADMARPPLGHRPVADDRSKLFAWHETGFPIDDLLWAIIFAKMGVCGKRVTVMV